MSKEKAKHDPRKMPLAARIEGIVNDIADGAVSKKEGWKAIADLLLDSNKIAIARMADLRARLKDVLGDAYDEKEIEGGK